MIPAIERGRALHVVQIGYDDSVFNRDAASDTVVRQLLYGRALDELRPGSRLSVVMFTNRPEASPYRQDNVVFIPVRPKGPLGLLSLYGSLGALHREQPVDAIATQTVYEDALVALVFGKPRSIQVVGQVHNDFFSPVARREMLGGGLLGKLRSALGSVALGRLDAVRAVGARTRKRMVSEKLNGNVHVIPVPVTMLLDANGEAPELEPEKARVLFVGRLVTEKNLEEWLSVAGAVAGKRPDVEFAIVGDGPLRPVLEARTRSLGLGDCVRFLGLLPYDRLSPVYRSSTVFLLTSHCEGAPRVVFEACSQGLPVVGTRISGVEDVIENGKTGFLHDNGDVQGMAASVLALLNDPELRERIGRAARARVLSGFAPEKLAKDWMSVLVSAAR